MRTLSVFAALAVLFVAVAALGGRAVQVASTRATGPVVGCLAETGCRTAGLLAMAEIDGALAALDGSEGVLVGDRVGQDHALPDWHLTGIYTRAALEWLLDHLWAAPPRGYAHVLELAFDVE
ncbi:MAG: hypothetical protein QN194_14560 [Armatimonadota bacterium]|nr:hypothetical protein [Armatimonadota bacterium]MDR7574131.1 hypothetical protein [Armatimonadota bacterium]